MSISPPNAAAQPTLSGGADQLIDQRILEACDALWWAELIRDVLRTLIVALMAVLAWVVVDQWVYSPSVPMRVIAAIALAAWIVWRVAAKIIPLLSSSIRPEYAARALERDLPNIKQQLTSYVTLRHQRERPGLRSRVVRSIGSRVAGNLKTHDALPVEATGTLKWWLAATAALALLLVYAAVSPKNTLASVSRLVAPLAAIDSPKRVSIREVKPGDTDAIAGRRISVTALVEGLKDDESVFCRWDSSAGKKEATLKFDESTLRFIGEIQLDHAATGEVAYFVEAGDGKSGPYWLSVENVPVVALQSVHYQPPEYTGEVPHTSSSGAITAVDGTNVTILATTSRPIAKATIEFNPRLLGDTIRATAGAKSMDIDKAGTGLTFTFPLRSARGRSAAVQLESYRMRVWDSGDQTNPDPIVYPIRVIADLPPEVSIVMPRKTPKNLPVDGQQIIEVHAMDPDFGLKQLSLKVQRGIDVVSEPSLWSDPEGAKGNQVAEYRFRPQEHDLRVGDVVKIVAVATDNRLVADNPSIEPNVSITDAIELRIVASEQLPKQPDGNDGLSEPDNRPPSDDPGDKSSASDANSDNSGQGDQQQTGGGSGEEGSSTEDGNGGGGESGQGNETTEGAEPGEEGSGTGQGTESGDQGSEATGENPADGSKPASGDPNSENPNTGDPNKGDPNSGEPNAGNPGSDASNDPSGQSNPDGQPNDQPGQETGTDNPGPNTPDGSPDAANPNSDPNANPSEGGQGDQANEAPPKHDGEAFERIRDYLEKKKREEQSGNQDPSKGSPDPQHQPPGSEREPQSGTDGSENKPGQESGDDPRAKPEQESGDDPGGKPGQEAGDEPGAKPGQESGDDPGAKPGQESGDDPGAKPGQESGDEPGAKPGQESGDDPGGKPGQEAGDEPGANPGQESGDDPGAKPGQESGDDPGGNPGQESGDDPGAKPGQESGDDPGAKPGQESGDDPGAKPGQESGDDPGSKPGQETGDDPGAKPGQESGQDSGSKPGQDGSAANSPPNDGQPSTDGTDSASSNDAASSTQGTTSQADGDASGTNAGTASPPPPAEPDLEYTKKATDMVLDYLKETRDKPDSDLLKDLNWSEEDLKRFADRWQKVRDLDQPAADAQANPDIEEALRSLGLRPQASDSALENRDAADTLRGIRDSGNRKPPPPAYRDVFEAFRRAVGRE